MENMEKRSDDLQGKVREMEQKTGELKEVSNVNDRIDNNFEKMQSFEASEMNDLKSAMKKKLNEIVEQNPVNFSEIVRQQVTESLEAVSDDLRDVKNFIEQTKEQAVKQRDKENRRNNIIMYRVPESDEMRAEERNKADVAFCVQLFNNCLHTGITEDDLINVFRLGHNQDPHTPRPVMIQFAIYTSKT